MMNPQIELYLNTEREWVSESLLERFTAALNDLLPVLLACPPGPDHVLSELPVVEIAVVDDETIARVHAEFWMTPARRMLSHSLTAKFW